MKTKKWLLLALCLLLALAFVPATARAEEYSGQCGDDLYWSYDESNGTLTITGSGAMWDYDSRPPWHDHQYGITTVKISDGTTHIGKYAFDCCYYLTSVSFPSGMESIGDNAFRYCSSIKSLRFSKWIRNIGAYAFFGCDELQSVYFESIGLPIPGEETYIVSGDLFLSIGNYAFAGCKALKTLSLSDHLEIIGDHAFDGCKRLTSLTLGEWVRTIGESAFESCDGLTGVTIPASVVKIGRFAFTYCNDLEWIEVENGNWYYSSIDGVLFTRDKHELLYYPFGSWTTSYTIPESVTRIGDYAFYHCVNLRNITIPPNVESIGNSAFEHCINLSRITNQAGFTSIGERAFWECYKLTSVTLPGTVTSIGSWAFYHCNNLTDINIPDSVTSIGKGVFYDCRKLSNILIPGSIESVTVSAFRSCQGLTEVTIQEGVFRIEEEAFRECVGLTTITLPNSLTSIDRSAFTDCTGLTSITVASDNQNYKDVDGVLFTKDGKELLVYPAGRAGSYTIPSSVTSISGNAFSMCTGLTSITIPSSVTIIGSYAFNGCTGLKTVKYGGTQAQKAQMSIGEYNEPLLNATWKCAINVSFNANDGAVSPTTKVVQYGQAYGTLPTPTRSGYIFDGWWTTKETGGKQVTASTVCYASGNYTLYARWTPKTYTVTLNPNGGTVSPTTKTVTYGQAYGALPTPTRSGYTFLGWWTAKETGGKQVTATTVCYASGNYTLYASWKAGQTYTVTLNANGGTCGTSTKTVTYGTAYGTMPVPKRLGYTFAGWWTVKDAGGKKVTASTICYATGNYTLYARWTEGYTMTFDPNGGAVSPTTKVVKYGQQYGAMPTPTRAGYTFTGWWTTKAEGGKKVVSTTVCYAASGYTLYARWTAKKFVVTLNPNGGECATATKTVTYGQAYGTMPVPSPRTGYTFAGWYTAKTGGKKVTATTVCYASGNYTLYARWTPKTYTITFNPNGGSCSTASKKVTYAQQYGTLPTPTRAGYTFAGWFTTQTTGGKQVFSSTVCYATGNYTLYARWTKN
ncbi:MAG: leucine-rich repeat protein [Clostridia bacterium]|nr:leucine-rich repeat protein [Clostridia bacterium]